MQWEKEYCTGVLTIFGKKDRCHCRVTGTPALPYRALYTGCRYAAIGKAK